MDEISCHVWEDESPNPEDHSFPIHSPKFSFFVRAFFTSPPPDDDDDYPGLEDFATVVSEKTHEVEVALFLNDTAAAVNDMLCSMDFPVVESAVEKISACAVAMVGKEKFRNRRVLRIRVEMEALVEEPPSEWYPAIDLCKVTVIKGSMSCAICLEEMGVGSEASNCLPCSHIFHVHCIGSWLRKRRSCPLCRFELQS